MSEGASLCIYDLAYIFSPFSISPDTLCSRDCIYTFYVVLHASRPMLRSRERLHPRDFTCTRVSYDYTRECIRTRPLEHPQSRMHSSGLLQRVMRIFAILCRTDGSLGRF